LDGKDKRSLGEYVERTWTQVEKGVEEAVHRSLSRVKVPRREALLEISTRLERLEARVRALEDR
jgi:polyhydroxyalkanoate synthesis regulator phasin